MLVNAIVDKLKQGTIPTVYLFSDTDTVPEPPYVVVKPETGSLPNTRQFRIIVHANQGQFDLLEKYAFIELDRMLLGGVIDDEGYRYKLYVNGFTDIMPEPDDNTFFMERIYFTPLRSG